MQASYISRVVRLAFLSPAVFKAVLKDSLRAGVDGVRLIACDAIPMLWSERVAAFLPG